MEVGKAFPQATPDTLTPLHTQDTVLQVWKAAGPFPLCMSFFRESLGNCTSPLVTFCETWFTCFLTGAQCSLRFPPCKLTIGYSTFFKARLTGFALEDPEPPLPQLVLPTRVGPVPPSWCLPYRFLAFLLALPHIQQTELGEWHQGRRSPSTLAEACANSTRSRVLAQEGEGWACAEMKAN